MMTASFIAFIVLVGYGVIVLVFWVGCRLVIEGDLSAGQLIAFIM